LEARGTAAAAGDSSRVALDAVFTNPAAAACTWGRLDDSLACWSAHADGCAAAAAAPEQRAHQDQRAVSVGVEKPLTLALVISLVLNLVAAVEVCYGCLYANRVDAEIA
jgi:hypothetical protein